jgi:protein-L-isoaspartate(D-aspartate) O-methyltransferase
MIPDFLKTRATGATADGEDRHSMQRGHMVEEISAMAHEIYGHGEVHISTNVLDVLEKVPRHRFVPEDENYAAYFNHPLPIGHGQTISQPFIVALMTELLTLNKHDRVLEVGTGSGYQAAVLAEMAGEIYCMEIVEPLAKGAKALLNDLGYANVQVKNGDGYIGWPEHAPFDAIIVTAAATHVPQPLLDQIKPGGRMVIPVGEYGATQQLLLIRKSQDGELQQKNVLPVSFVPLTGGHDA